MLQSFNLVINPKLRLDGEAARQVSRQAGKQSEEEDDEQASAQRHDQS